MPRGRKRKVTATLRDLTPAEREICFAPDARMFGGGEMYDSEVVSSFRIAAKTVHLTYPMHIPFDTLDTMWTGTFPQLRLLYKSYVHENGKPDDTRAMLQYKHTHVAATFDKRLQSQNPRVFDIPNKNADGSILFPEYCSRDDGSVIERMHPNIRTGERHVKFFQNCATYHTKTWRVPEPEENEEQDHYDQRVDTWFTSPQSEGGIADWPKAEHLLQVLPTQEDAFSADWMDLTTCGVDEVAKKIQPEVARTVSDVRALASIGELREKQQIRALREKPIDQPYRNNDWKDYGYEKHMNTRCLIVYGPSNAVKTHWSLHFFQNPLLVKHIDDLRWFNREKHDGIVFDDMSFAEAEEHIALAVSEIEMDTSVHCRYKPAQIPKGTPRIFTRNSETGSAPVFNSIVMAMPQVAKRVRVIKVKSRMCRNEFSLPVVSSVVEEFD